MALVLTVFIIFLLLLGNEWWWRKHAVHNEFSRKFVHVTVGSFVAFWPLYLSWDQIKWLSLAFLLVIAISRYLNLFRAIHSVLRPTWGEIYFALAVGVIALMTQDHWIYMAALLQMSLADGVAAIVGVRYAKQSYLVFGHRKSIIGSFSFFIASLAILLVYELLSGAGLNPVFLAGVAALATIVENLGVRGLDNLLVPILVTWLLVMY